MLTQKDIHNLLVENMSVQQKIDISMRCGNDPTKIEKAEKTVAEMYNLIGGAGLEYLNKRI